MAHEFYIKTTSGEFVTYTDYDAIDLTTLKHVIKFIPDLGTLVDSHEILLETGTLNASATEGVITEEDNSVTATDGTTYAVPAENKLLLEDSGQIMYENAALNPLGKLVPEQFTDGVALVEDISLASFVRVSDSMPDNDVRDVTFNNDGTKMFVLGRANDNVYEYSVATAWNVSSITLVRTLDISVVSSTQGDNAANSIEFNTDGTKLFVLGQGQDNVDEYALTTGFDLSTASFTRSLDISGKEDQPYGIAFNNDGTKMFITGRRGDDVNEYILTTGFDISTASYSQKFSIDQGNGRPSAVRFNSDGTKMFILEGGTTAEGDNTIFQYTLTTAFDVSTASYSDKSFSPYNEEEKPRGFCFGDNGTQLYVAGWRGDDINQYAAADTIVGT
jgi:6-phosphogluconolactonase (cycloisomerase 2 family)